jgi:pyruvate dehydrogenase E1 component alpha subunit
VKGRLLRANQATEEDLKKIDAEIRDIVTASADFATNDPQPDASELWTDIYVEA